MQRSWLHDLEKRLAKGQTVVRVVVAATDGSVPREPGASMLVEAKAASDTIGGGALEASAIAHARAMIDSILGAVDQGTPGSGTTNSAPAPAWLREERRYPLGPSLGQCCGGHVSLLFEVFGPAERSAITRLAASTDRHRDAVVVRPVSSGRAPELVRDGATRDQLPPTVAAFFDRRRLGEPCRMSVRIRGETGGPAWLAEFVHPERSTLYLYGAGHVGRAVVDVAAALPFRIVWVDTAAARFPAYHPDAVEIRAATDPVAVAVAAAPDAYHLVMTYSHALDLAICHGVLERDAFAFLGLIGSATKRARFERRLASLGIPDVRFGRLTCPIGIAGITGKEPHTIAVAAVAQLLQVREAAATQDRPRPLLAPAMGPEPNSISESAIRC